MNYYRVPIGFGMALAMNPQALSIYSAMTQNQKQAILSRAHNAHSQQEMHEIINSIIRNRMQGQMPLLFVENIPLRKRKNKLVVLTD